MNTVQQTIKKSTSCSGVGLHTGVPCSITFKPASENAGIRFVRTDIDGCPEIQADIGHVVDISRGTTLEENGVRVHTVEHVLAAVLGLEIDNVLIELTNKEPPVMDGSCKDFVEIIHKAGIKAQKQPREYLEIDKAITLTQENKSAEISVLPSDSFRISCVIDYDYPQIGTQYFTIHSLKDFPKEIAPARTFCLLSEVEKLRAEGLARGGGFNNTIVFVDKKFEKEEIHHLQALFNIKENITVGSEGILQEVKLRVENEPVRHKVLDLIGDLALLGLPIKGHVIATKSGHATNVEMVKKIKLEYEKKILQKRFQTTVSSEYLFNISAISKIMPHRYPFLLVDRILNMTPGESLVAIKNVTMNEPFFQGHFPTQPVMPGVLILEAMAQAGGFLLLHTTENPELKMMYFAGVENARFRQPVFPGDQVRLELKLLKIRLGSAKIHGKAYVGDIQVAEATFLATVADRKTE